MIFDKIAFLQNASYVLDDGSALGLFGFFFAFLLLFLFILAIVYVYVSFAYFYIAKKAKLKTPGLAWIPG